MEALILEKQPLALGAYSTKVLRRDYQRAIMRVRRTADGAQADVRGDSNGEISLDSRIKIASGSSNATTFGEFVAHASYTDVDSLGSPSVATVSIWYDQSGSNKHLTQTVTNYQPRITGTNGVIYRDDNGPTILFFPTTVDPKYMDCRELVGDFTVHMNFRLLGVGTTIKLYDGTNDLIEASRSTNTVSLSQITASAMSLNGYDKKGSTSIDFDSAANNFLTVSGTFASTGNTRVGGNAGALTDLYIYPKAKKGKQRREVEAISSRESGTLLAYSNRQDIDTNAFLNKFEGAAAAFSLRSLNNSSDTKLATIRRTVDNKEAIVFPDSSGYISLESPVRWWSPKTSGVTPPSDVTSKATLLGQFVGDSSYSDVDSLGSPSSAHVVELFDQASQNEIFGRRLLDYHTGAEVAYSTKRLSTSYTGACLEVSIGVGGSVVEAADIEFDASGSIIANLNAFYNQKLVQYGSASAFAIAISKWYDQSGNGRHLTQSNLSNMLQITYSDKNGEIGVVGGLNILKASTSAFSVATPFSYSFSFDHGTTSDCDIVRFDTTVAAGISSGNYVAKDGANTVIAGSSVNQRVKSFYGVHDSASSEVGLDGSYTTGSNLTNGVTSINLFPTSGPLVTVYDFILWGENKSTDELDKQDIDLYSKDVYRTQDPNAKAIISTAQPKIYDATNGLVTDGGRVAMEVVSGNYFVFDKERIAGKPNVSLFASFNSDDTRGGLWGLESGYRGPYFHSTSASSYVSNFGSPSTFSDSDEKTITNAITAYNEVIDGTKNTFSLINGDATSWTVPTTQYITLFNFIYTASSSDTLTGKYHEFVFFTTDVASDREAIEADMNSAFGSFSLANLRRQERLLNQFPGAAAAYSVRQVNANYLGPIIRIDNGYTEIDIYPLPNGDLDTATIIQHAKVNTITEAAGVSVWYDQSGNGNDAVQAVNANQPLICDNGVVFYENGKPAVDFDGSNDTLTISNDSLHRNVGYSHLYSVNASDVTGVVQTYYFAATGDNSNSKSRINLAILNTNEANIGGRRLDTDSGASVASTATLSANTQYLRASEFSFASSDLHQYLNGNLDGTSTSFQTDGNTSDTDSLNSAGANITIGTLGGTANKYNGTIQELVIYTSDQSSNRHKIESNINTYFDIYPQTPTDLLLDKNPDAAAAYSLRKLRRTYAGPAVKVRRASDNVEADVYFDRNNEVSLESRVANVSETTTGSSQGSATFTLAVPTLGEFLGDASYVSGGATDGFVVVWYDQAKSNNAEQLAAASQPKMYDTTEGLVVENGKPAIDLDGVNDNFVVPSIALNAYFSTSLVLKPDVAGGFLLEHSSNSNNADGFYLQGNVGETFNLRRTVRDRYNATSGWVGTNQTLVTLNSNGTPTLHKDGASITLTPNSVAGVANTSVITELNLFSRDSSSIFYNGKAQEIVIYNSDQSSNRTKIETDINNHYSIYQNTPEGGLLNQYGDAAAAYSLRALDFSYSGPLVRVRRDSDHVEADVYADENGVFSERSFIRNVSETSTGVTVGAPNDSRAFRFGEFAYGANCFLVEWKDQSGSDNHASQNVATSQPKIYDATTGVVTENGKPAVQFIDASSTLMSFTPFTPSSDFSVIFVAENGANNNDYMLSGSGSGNVLYASSTTQFRARINYTFYDFATSIGSGSQYLGFLNRASNSLTFAADSNLSASTFTTSNALTLAALSYGGANGYNFKMSEVILYPSDQSSNRTNIEDNINKFYKIY